MRAHYIPCVVFAIVLVAGCSQPGSPTSPTLAAASAGTMTSGLGAPAGSGDVNGATATTTVPFKGRLEGTYAGTGAFPVITVHVTAEGNATHLGRFTFDSLHDVDLRTLTGAGTVILTAANGDTLTATETGVATPQDTPGVFLIVETVTVTGGSGRFAGATGEFVVERLSVPTGPDTGTTVGSFDGSLTLAHGQH